MKKITRFNYYTLPRIKILLEYVAGFLILAGLFAVGIAIMSIR